MPQEDYDYDRDDHQFFDQRSLQILDGPEDQLGTVIRRDNLHAGRQAFFDVMELLFYLADEPKSVFALAHYDDTRHGVSGSVPVGDTPADVRSQGHVSDVGNTHRNA